MFFKSTTIVTYLCPFLEAVSPIPTWLTLEWSVRVKVQGNAKAERGGIFVNIPIDSNEFN